MILFTVEDNGIGMTPEEKNRCMEPFYTTKEVGKGTGIGLTVIQRMIDAQKGTIKAESEYGKGTTFFITLPAEVKK